MVEAKDAIQWVHTSSIIAAMYNTNGFGSKKTFSPNEFNPYFIREKKKQPVEPWIDKSMSQGMKKRTIPSSQFK